MERELISRVELDEAIFATVYRGGRFSIFGASWGRRRGKGSCFPLGRRRERDREKEKESASERGGDAGATRTKGFCLFVWAVCKVAYATGKISRVRSRDLRETRKASATDASGIWIWFGETGGPRTVEGLKRAGGLECSYGRAGRGIPRGGTEGSKNRAKEQGHLYRLDASLAAIIIAACRRRQGRSASEQQHLHQRQPSSRRHQLRPPS